MVVSCWLINERAEPARLSLTKPSELYRGQPAPLLAVPVLHALHDRDRYLSDEALREVFHDGRQAFFAHESCGKCFACRIGTPVARSPAANPHVVSEGLRPRGPLPPLPPPQDIVGDRTSSTICWASRSRKTMLRGGSGRTPGRVGPKARALSIRKLSCLPGRPVGGRTLPVSAGSPPGLQQTTS
ncbi:hypothetical protein DYH09_07995 [bacterium CPR1]|nr:hypothetical protein [bacterium CPR1]